MVWSSDVAHSYSLEGSTRKLYGSEENTTQTATEDVEAEKRARAAGWPGPVMSPRSLAAGRLALCCRPTTHAGRYRSKLRGPPLSTFATMSTEADTLTAARSAVADTLAFDILSATQDLDNEKQLQEISRSFVCTCARPWAHAR
jgi:hypothetical protein